MGGAILSRSALYHLLSNPAYRGAIWRGKKAYSGCHPAIIDEATWTGAGKAFQQYAPTTPIRR